MNMYFTADLHFNHEKIIGYCKRPFSDVQDMNRRLIKNWNETVEPDDSIIVLGDFAFGRRKHKEMLRDIVERLNGNKSLIIGSHDDLHVRDYIEIGFMSVHSFYHTNVFGSATNGDVYLTHDPAVAITDKNRLWLCGHVHDLFKRVGNVINVGVDVWNYQPVSVEQIIEVIKEDKFNIKEDFDG